MISENKINLTNKSYKNFQIQGYLMGGLGPVDFFLISELYNGKNQFPFLLLCICGNLIGIIALLFDHFDHKDTKPSKTFSTFFLIQAIFSCILIHVIVLYTGGATSSVFVGSYLYLIAIIGYTFGAGPNLFGAAMFFGLSYLANLYFLDFQLNIFQTVPFLKKILICHNDSFATASVEQWVYMFVFLSQGIITTYIAATQPQSNEKRTNL